MFRRVSIGKGSIAFLLSLTFLWSWAACSLLCNEIAERHEKQSYSANELTGENCLTVFDMDRCPVQATTAIIEARQTVFSSVLAVQNIASIQSLEFSFVPVSIYPADLNQNSPPRFSSAPPRFLRHCTFRI